MTWSKIKEKQLEKTVKSDVNTLVIINYEEKQPLNNINNSLAILQNSQVLSNTEKEAVPLAETCRSIVNEQQALKEMFLNNMILQPPSTQRLINKVYSDQKILETHCNGKMITDLSERLIRGLRVYVNDLLPASSSLYKLNGAHELHLEEIHTTTHLVETIAHSLLNIEVLYATLHSTLHPVGLLLPVIGLIIKSYEIYKEHQLLHKAQLVRPLCVYSESERTVLYTYVINSTLLAMDTRFGNGKPIGHRAETKELRDKLGILDRWLMLLLAESIFALGSLKKADNIELFASNWQKVLFQKFQLQEKTMKSYKEKEMKTQLIEENQVDIAVRVQSIFTDAIDLSNYPDLPKFEGYVDAFHHQIYKVVLKPYKRRTEEHYIAAFLCGYNRDEYKNLREFQLRFSRALELLRDEIYPHTINNRSPNIQFQLALINSCLYGNLQKMHASMPWHEEVKILLAKKVFSNYGNTDAPLKLQGETGDYEIVAPSINKELHIEQLEAEVITFKDNLKDANFKIKELELEISKLKLVNEQQESRINKQRLGIEQQQLEINKAKFETLQANPKDYPEKNQADIPNTPNTDAEKAPISPLSPKNDAVPLSENRHGLYAVKTTPMQQNAESINTTDTCSTHNNR